MPIVCAVPITPVDQDAFHEIDYEVMRHAFDIHNQVGRLLSEEVYGNALEARLLETGKSVSREVRIDVAFRNFKKRYFIDLLVDGSAIFEVKAVDGLAYSHRAQLLNYLFLTGLRHGKLINFRSRSVESRFVSTKLCFEDRRSFLCDTTRLEDDRYELLEIVTALATEWGTNLSIQLYREALIHFLGGADRVLKMVDVSWCGGRLGEHGMYMLDPETALHVSGLSHDRANFERHMSRLLMATGVKRLQWINFDHHLITFKTLKAE